MPNDKLTFREGHNAFRSKVYMVSEGADMHDIYKVAVSVAGYKNVKEKGDSEWYIVHTVECGSVDEALKMIRFVDVVVRGIASIEQLGYLKTADFEGL